MGLINFNNKGNDFETANFGGIYGIFVDKKPIYIGYTMRSFKERFAEHNKGIKNKENKFLYKEMTDYERENYTFKILFDIEKVKYARKCNGGFNRHELKCIECAFIQCFKPKYNKSGKNEPYYFNSYT